MKTKKIVTILASGAIFAPLLLEPSPMPATDPKTQVLFICPAAHRRDLSDLLRVLASFGSFFAPEHWPDAVGQSYVTSDGLAETYYAACLWLSNEAIEQIFAEGELKRPTSDPQLDGQAYIISMAAANRAKDALFHNAALSTDHITVFVGGVPSFHIESLGLTQEI